MKNCDSQFVEMDNYHDDRSVIENLGTSYVALDDHIEVSHDFFNFLV